VVSDNGPQFVSQEFDLVYEDEWHQAHKNLTISFSIKRCCGEVSTNIKKAMIASNCKGASKLQASFLLSYRTTPSTNTSRTVYEQNVADSPGPDVECSVKGLQKANYDKKAKVARFVIGQRIMVRDGSTYLVAKCCS